MTKEEEIWGTIGMLRSIADVAESSSLTGSLRGGTKISVRHYNAILQRLQALDVLAPEQFTPMGEEAAMDEVGVAAAHLAAYLKAMQGKGRVYNREFMGEAFQKMDETFRNVFGGGPAPRQGPSTEEAKPEQES